MTTIVIRVPDDDGEPAPHALDDATLSPDDVRALLDHADEGDVAVRRDVRRADWERGDPCPVCGNETLHVFELVGATYRSAGGEFVELDRDADAGPQLSVGCPACLTYLAHVPYRALTE